MAQQQQQEQQQRQQQQQPAVVRLTDNEAHRRNAPKVVLCGMMNVGKTSLVQQMEKGHFGLNETCTTHGMEFHAITTGGENNRALHLWDLAGQMQASAANLANFRNATGVLVVSALDSPESIEGMRRWLREIRVIWRQLHGVPLPDDTAEGRRTPMPVRTFLVFNKKDLYTPTREELAAYKDLVDAYGCHGSFFTTATEHENVAEMFRAVAEDLAVNTKAPPAPPPDVTPGETKGCCSGGKKSESPKPKRLERRR